MNEQRIKAALNLRGLEDSQKLLAVAYAVYGAGTLLAVALDLSFSDLDALLRQLKEWNIILPDGRIDGEEVQPLPPVTRPMLWGKPVAPPQFKPEEATKEPSQGPLAMLLARVVHSPKDRLPKALAAKLDDFVEGQQSFLLPPNKMYLEDERFREWVRQKITYFLSDENKGDRNAAHLVNLIRSYERGGWLKIVLDEENTPSTAEGLDL